MFSFILKAIFLLATSTLVGCGGGGANQKDNSATAFPSTAKQDTVKIISVTPTTAVAGDQTTFTVVIQYSLTSKDFGIIYLGFNIESPIKYHLADEQVNVTRGSSTVSITSNTIPVGYTAPYNFSAYVNLSEDPHPSAWTPLAIATQPISVQAQQTGASTASLRLTQEYATNTSCLSVQNNICSTQPVKSN